LDGLFIVVGLRGWIYELLQNHSPSLLVPAGMAVQTRRLKILHPLWTDEDGFTKSENPALDYFRASIPSEVRIDLFCFSPMSVAIRIGFFRRQMKKYFPRGTEEGRGESVA
jgi:hypothetical protein